MIDASFERACALRDVSGALLLVALQHGRVLIGQLKDGSVHAFAELCPHQMGRLDPASMRDGCVTCPVHGYKFEIADGACVSPREPLRLRKYDVRVLEGVVYVRLPKPNWRS